MIFSQTKNHVNREWVVETTNIDTVKNIKSEQDINGDLYVLGNKFYSSTNTQIWLQKYDPNGTLIWDVVLGDIYKDFAVDLLISQDGNPIVLWASAGANLTYKSTIQKFDANSGSSIWSANDTYVNNTATIPSEFVLDDQSNIFITGVTFNTNLNREAFVSCYSSNGLKVWQNSYDYSNLNDAGLSIKLSTNQESVCIAGASESTLNNFDFFTATYATIDGHVDIDRRVAAPGYLMTNPIGLIQDENDKFILAGTVINSNQKKEVKLLHLDDQLIIENVTAITDSGDNVFVESENDAFGNTIVLTDFKNSSNRHFIRVSKFDFSGTEVWRNDFYQHCIGRKLTIKGNQIVISGSDFSGPSEGSFLLLLDLNGKELWHQTFTNVNKDYRALDVDVNENGELYVSGTVNEAQNSRNYILKYTYKGLNYASDCLGVDSICFVPGHVIIRFDKSVIISDFLNDTLREFILLDDLIESNVLVEMENATGKTIRGAGLHAFKIYKYFTESDSMISKLSGGNIHIDPYCYKLIVEVPNSTDVFSFCQNINSIIAKQDISGAWVDLLMKTQTDDLLWSQQTALHAADGINNAHINIEQAWNEYGYGERFVRIAVIDNGVFNVSSPDFGGLTKDAARDFFNFPNQELTESLIIDNGLDSHHATGTASIIGAFTDNDEGIAGVAGGKSLENNDGCVLYSMGCGTGFESGVSSSLVESALQHIYAINNNFENNVNIVNMSFGSGSIVGFDYNVSFYQELNDLYRSGVTIVVSRGNSYFDPSIITEVPQGFFEPYNQNYPGDYIDRVVISVGASNREGFYQNSKISELLGWLTNNNGFEESINDCTEAINGESYYTQIGRNVDLLAPGVTKIVRALNVDETSPYNDVLKPELNDCEIIGPGYSVFNGTSASAAYVAGAAGLLMSEYNIENFAPNNLASDDIEQLLEIYATDLDLNFELPSAPDEPQTVIEINTFDGVYNKYCGNGRLNVYETIKKVDAPAYQILHIDPDLCNNLYDFSEATMECTVTHTETDLSQDPFPDNPGPGYINNLYLFENIASVANTIGTEPYFQPGFYKITNNYTIFLDPNYEVINKWPLHSFTIGLEPPKLPLIGEMPSLSLSWVPYSECKFELYESGFGPVVDVECSTYTYNVGGSGVVAGPPKWAPAEPSLCKTAFTLHLKNNDINSSADVFDTNNLHLSPNPAFDKINISTSNSANFSYIVLCSIDGRILRDLNFEPTNNYVLPIEDLPSGVYLVKVISNGSSINQLFIKN